MRVCLVAHGFPPHERTGVENYTEALAAALVRAGAQVVVFAPRRVTLPELSSRREERDGYAIEWLTLRRDAASPGEALDRPDVTRLFGRFLEHERPTLVHFQHVYKLGVGLLEETRRRGLPCVYTAHDYYPVCHRYTLLRPDLSHCEIRGDPMVCARCDLALGFLNRIAGLGDYQMGVLPEQLAPAQWRGLHALLEDDPGPAGLDREAVDAAFDARLALDARRARAFQAVDLVLAPTRFLAEELVRGGLERGRIEVLPYGIANADLCDLPPVRRDPTAPVRFAYFGGLSKHKGVHVLLEAFGRLRAPAELSIRGYSTDAPYVERLRRASSAGGVVWHGGYERSELPAFLAETDVVVVPSIWAENYPLVIREAFSARRPVLASRFGALGESVRDGVDGLLFERGDPASLAGALERCVSEPGLVEQLARGVQPVKSIDEQARELLERYRGLAAGRASSAAPAPAPPAALAPYLEHHARLSALPTHELLSRVLRGIGALQRGLGGEVAALPAAGLLEAGLRRGSDARDELRELRSKAEWLQASLEAVSNEPKAAALRREADWLRGLADDRGRELAWRLEGKEELKRLLAAACAEVGTSAFDHGAERPVAHYAFDLVQLLLGEQRADPEHQARLLVQRSGAGVAPGGGAALSGARDVERDELAWRRGEMAAAARLSPWRWLRLLLRRTALGRRVARWGEPPGGGA